MDTGTFQDFRIFIKIGFIDYSPIFPLNWFCQSLNLRDVSIIYGWHPNSYRQLLLMLITFVPQTGLTLKPVERAGNKEFMAPTNFFGTIISSKVRDVQVLYFVFIA